MRSTLILSALATSLVLAAPAAFAQEEEEHESPPPKKTVTATTTTTTSAAPAAAAPVDTTTDHEKVVGHMGVGYMGGLDTPLGTAGSLTAHIVGIRYWLQSGFAISAGLGFGSSSSASSNGTTVEGPAATTLALKGGAPIALATGKHYTFVIEPQLVFGYATQTVKQAGGNVENTGMRFAVGATAGAEIQFGFIGIPELALVGSIGLAFDTRNGKTTQPNREDAVSATGISTFTMANPWNIFSGNIAAIYYF